MQALVNQVYIEEQFPGVTLGAIALPHGLIQPAPPMKVHDPILSIR